jgi:parvulin-like peptidyl-prolyl isomerase
LYPVLWIATIGVATVMLVRPGGPGGFPSLAANWESVPGFDPNTPFAPRAAFIPPATSAPRAPSASARPSAWPGGSAFPPDSDGPVYGARASGVRRLPPVAAEPAATDTWRPRSEDRDSDPEPAQPPTGSGRAPPAEAQRLVWQPPPVELPLGPDPGPIGLREAPQISSPPPVQRPPEEVATPCEGAEVLARVGPEIILAGELLAGIPEMRAKNAQVPKDILEAKIREILKQRLDQKIDEKLVCQHAARTLPKENFPKIKDNVAREFENSQVPRMMKGMKAQTRQELEEMLRATGTSLEMQKRTFVEQVLAHEWIKQQIKVDDDVGHGEMLDYYRKHVAEFETPPRARWEQLTVRLSRFPSPAEARDALARMGNQVLDGARLADVARAQSQGATASEGGFWDWTTRGSLAADVLDRAIFGDGTRPGLPVGMLSPILEEPQALHIIRVIERQESRRTPFLEAQVEIKKKIREEREAKARQEYLAKLRRETPVWTAFDSLVSSKPPDTGRYIR